jgi:hypothetical protein
MPKSLQLLVGNMLFYLGKHIFGLHVHETLIVYFELSIHFSAQGISNKYFILSEWMFGTTWKCDEIYQITDLLIFTSVSFTMRLIAGTMFGMNFSHRNSPLHTNPSNIIDITIRVLAFNKKKPS